MSFAKVDLLDVDLNKLKCMVPEGKTSPEILYDGKLFICRMRGSPKDPFFLICYKGLKKTRAWDSTNKKYLDTWTGDWEMIAQLSSKISTMSPAAAKLKAMLDHIKKEVEEAYQGAGVVIEPPYIASYIEETNAKGIKINKGIDPEGGISIKIKTGFTAPPGSPTMMENGRTAPTYESRTPKCKFYNTAAAKDKMLVLKPEVECQGIRMKIIPDVFINIFTQGSKIYITKKALTCYYEISAGGGGPDDDLLGEIASLRLNEGSSSTEGDDIGMSMKPSVIPTSKPPKGNVDDIDTFFSSV